MIKICILLILLPAVLSSQTKEQKQISGQILNEYLPFQDVVITNLSTEKSTVSNDKGLFKIKVTAGDILTFSHISISSFSEKVTHELTNLEIITIQVSDKVNQLDEVTVNAFPNLNALSLRIIDHEIEELTVNQRRLRTAGDFKPIHLLSILGGSLALDPIINKISGRTDKLKKLIKFDKDEDYFDYINENHGGFIRSELKISEEGFNRFIYLLVESIEIKNAIDSGNDSQLRFFIQDLAIRHKEEQTELIFDEK